jgi:ABC-type transporter Mla subunit MlaD
LRACHFQVPYKWCLIVFIFYYFFVKMSRSTSPVRVNILGDSDGEEMNSEHALNDLSTKIVNDVLPPEKESDLSLAAGGVAEEVEFSTEEFSKQTQETLDKLSAEASEVMNDLNEVSDTIGSKESSLSSRVAEGLKEISEHAQGKADEVSDWAKQRVDEVRHEFESHPNPPKEEDNQIIGDLKESAGIAEQQFEEISEKANKLIESSTSSPDKEDISGSFKVEHVLDAPMKPESGVPNAEPDPYARMDDASPEDYHMEKHSEEGHAYKTFGENNETAEYETREHRPSPDNMTAEEKLGSQIELPVINDPEEGIAGPDDEHLVVEEDDHKSHEHDNETSEGYKTYLPEGEDAREGSEVPLEDYEEPSPKKEATPDVPFVVKDADGEALVNPETYEGQHGDGTEGLSKDVQVSDVVDSALHDQGTIQVEDVDALPPLDINTSSLANDNVPTQIVIEDFDATHPTGDENKDDEEIKVETSQYTVPEEEPPSPPQLASQEHSPRSDSEDVSLDRKKRSIEDYPDSQKEPSPPSDSEGHAEVVYHHFTSAQHTQSDKPLDTDAFTKDTVPAEYQHDLPPLDNESSGIAYHNFSTRPTSDAVEGIKNVAKTAQEKTSEYSEKAQHKAAEVSEKVKETASEAYDKTQEKAADAYEKMGEFSENAEHKAAEVKEDVKEKASDFSENVKETAANVSEKTKEKASDVAEKAQATASEAYDKTQEKTSEVSEKVSDLSEKTKEKAADLSEKVQEKASDAYEKVKEKVGEASDKMGEYSEKAQHKAGEVSEKIQETASETYDKTKAKAAEASEKVKETASDVSEKAKEKAGEVSDWTHKKADEADSKIHSKDSPLIHVEDKAQEEVIVPRIVAPETKKETTTTITKTSETHHHVKPTDITPLPEDEPIPVGIPEVRTVETVKEEKEKVIKGGKKGSTSSEDDKAAPKQRQEGGGGIVGAVRRRCNIL